MFNVKNEGIILKPCENNFEKKAVLNPACIEIDGITHMFYRAVDKNDNSTIGYCQLKNGKVFKRFSEPLLKPEFAYERNGLEDPRITYLDGTYYLFYTAYDGKNALVACATATELPHFEKKGLITPNISYKEAMRDLKKEKLPFKYEYFENIYEEDRGNDILLWEKDIALFPQKFDGQFCLIHRILPSMQILFFDKFSDLNITFWKHYFAHLDENILLEGQNWYESRNIGGGCPPIKTKAGWLLIYHAVEDSEQGHVYRAGAALLDLKNPRKVIGRLSDPLFSPNYSYEKVGVVNNVVFPTSAIIQNNRLHIYHGAGDEVIALKSIDLDELLKTLLESHPTQMPVSEPSFT